MKRLLHSLRLRIFFAVATLLVLSSLLFGWLAIHQQTTSLKRALIERGQLSALHLAYGAELAVLTRDTVGLNSLLHNILLGNNMVFAEVYDAQGNFITAASSPTRIEKDEDPDRNEKQNKPSATEPWSQISDTIYEFRAPVTSEIALSDEAMLLDNPSETANNKQIIGTVHIALNTEGIQTAITHVIKQGVTTLLLLLLVALAATWWLARALTQRLEQMATVAHQIGDGDFTRRVTTTGFDEVAQLGQALNRMLDVLAERDAELHTQRRIMQTILDQAPIGVWMLDINGKIKFMNHTFSQTFGIAEQTFLEAPHYSALLSKKIADQCVASDQACFNSGRVHTSIEQITDAQSGTLRSYDIIKAPVRNENGQPEALIGLAIDITARIEAENEKATMQKQVEHTQRLESLGVLAGGIAHDFNNILTAIMGNAALAEQKIKHGSLGSCSSHMEKIVHASEKAALLCKQMLAYSGKGHFIIKPLHLTSMVESITSLLEVSIHRTIQLHYNMSENIALIEADEAQIQQVIMNLVINASDAIGEQSGTITITTGEMEADANYLANAVAQSGAKLPAGRYVFLEVSDTGCGMDSETQHRLFEPFFTTKFTGRGLGMSAVLGIVRGHHGAMMLYSEINKGTLFKVLFPIANRCETAPLPPPPPQATWVGHGTVLIIDDEETIRETASAMLEGMGFNTLTAVDGLDGVEVYRQQHQDIVAVLLDMTMPRLDGVGCFNALKQINPQVKVVLSSGYNEQESTHHFDNKGLAGFIQKPYWPEALENKIREVLT